MSANLVVDLRNTTDAGVSLALATTTSFAVGEIIDLANADTNCQLFCAGDAGSGLIEIRVQTSDSTASGTFTDPTSGLPVFPGSMVSGGIQFFNSGLHASGNQFLSSVVNNAPLFCSGGIEFAHFQRPHRYVRLIVNSGVYAAPFIAGVISNKRTTGSGGGFTYSPGSGTVSV